MASDLPDAFASPYDMARSLATYIDCPQTILKRVRSEFDTHITPSTIRAMIKSRRKPVVPSDPVCLGDGYYPGDERHKLEVVNSNFLWLLDQERLASQRRRELEAA